MSSLVHPIVQALDRPAAQALAWALLHFLWQGALLAGGLALLLRMIPSRRSNLRYGLAAVVLAAMPLLVAFTATRLEPGAAATVAIEPGPAAAATAITTSTTAATATAGAGHGPTADGAPLLATSFLARAQGLLAPGLPLLLATWLLGVMAFSLYGAGGWLVARRLLRERVTPASADWQERLRELAARLRVSRAVRLVESSRVEVPMVLGWLKPTLLVPVACLTGLSPRDLEAILLHELAHVRRHDYLMNLLQTAVETLLFYHPAVWWVSGQVRAEREHCCDDLAAAHLGDAVAYARSLARLEAVRSASPRWALAADGGAGSGALLARVRRLVAPLAGPGARRSHRREAVIGTGGALLVALVALGPGVSGGTATASAAATARATPATSASPASTASVSTATRSTPVSTATATSSSRAAGATDGTSLSGTWQLRPEDKGSYSCRLEAHFGNHGEMSSSHTVEAKDLAGLSAADLAAKSVDVRFSQPHDAGSFHFEGHLASGSGGGTFRFEPDPAFAARVGALGYPKPTLEQSLSLAIHDVKVRFIDDMKQLGYAPLSYDDLVAMAIHGVDSNLPRSLITAGFPRPSADELVSLRIHGVSLEFIDALGKLGYIHPTFDELVSLKIHGVEISLISALKQMGYANPTLDDLVAMKIHGIDVGLISSLQELGYEHPPIDDLVSLQIHGIKPAFIRDLAGLGYHAVPIDQLVSLKIHGVTIEELRRVAGPGKQNPPLDEVVERKIMGKL